MKKSTKVPSVSIRSSAAEYLTYVATVGDVDQSIEMRYENENVWLTQKMMAELYGVDVRTINEHISTIFKDGELLEDATIRNFRIVQTEGCRQVSREIKHYNLQLIISVGFKVNNERAVQFRKWAGQIVKDYTIQGWVMDKERLKKGHLFTDEYFERQLQNIREIRISERKFYQKVTDLYATAFDYDKEANTTRAFFQTVQNKMHWAVHRHTAAVSIAKNYLNDEEMEYLERIVTMYLDYAEFQAQRKIPMSMEDWAKRLDGLFRIVQDRLYHSDFDNFLELQEKLAEYKC